MSVVVISMWFDIHTDLYARMTITTNKHKATKYTQGDKVKTVETVETKWKQSGNKVASKPQHFHPNSHPF